MVSLYDILSLPGVIVAAFATILTIILVGYLEGVIVSAIFNVAKTIASDNVAAQTAISGTEIGNNIHGTFDDAKSILKVVSPVAVVIGGMFFGHRWNILTSKWYLPMLGLTGLFLWVFV